MVHFGHAMDTNELLLFIIGILEVKVVRFFLKVTFNVNPFVTDIVKLCDFYPLFCYRFYKGGKIGVKIKWGEE